ncbi:MAG TPA: replication-associated recombination protein A [Candidatus Acidoferrales bacterium]|nr:replication-associated recombination protein A [Candidatus Acidoferrales bacterium]
MGLFEPTGGTKARKGRAPLADRMRPQTLEEFLGQEHLVGAGQPLRVMIENDELTSMILWGPPGSGKTTLARLIARLTRCDFIPFSAVLAGIKEIKQVMAGAERAHAVGRRTIVFIDEIHRFNKAQQDAFLPYVEAGAVVLIGATTENPSFEVISPLLSRAKVYVLKALTPEQLLVLLERALATKERGLAELKVEVSPELLREIAVYANGDARVAYNTLEAAALGSEPHEGKRVLERAVLENVMQRRLLLYDKAGEEHFNLISALHKSVRNSDPDAALYWLGRMLEAGEDPLYVARRLVRMASEDIGLADPQALTVTMSAMQAVDFIGMPEGGLALAEAAVYLALAPKSNALYAGYGKVVEDVARTLAEPVPLHLRNPVTSLMKEVGYGTGYQYAHDFDDKTTSMPCLPESLRNRRYYLPTEEGWEKTLKQRMGELQRLKQKPKEK